jgi:3'-phosphoadenosine 5'-phosphosulfate sulfotransferase (PAPS reductase)/FAD synthetase
MFDALPLTLPTHPTRVVVSTSFGKDSIAALLKALETYDPNSVVAHYQVVLEEWPSTLEYGQRVCDSLGVPLYTAQGRYYGYHCLGCGRAYLSAHPEKAMCRPPKGCGSRDKQFLRMVEGVHDIIEWREKWVSKRVRACTKYFKVEVFNSWARSNKPLLGPRPLLVLGERWLESGDRTRIPELRYRAGLEAGWMLEWHPILDFRRIDSFRKLRESGIEPHYCYRVQWRELLREEHALWRAQGIVPHASYQGQWDGLREVDRLSDAILDPMIDQLMFEVDEESGGPRCSCVDCFFKSARQLRACYRTPQGMPVIEEAMSLEGAIGFTMKQGHTLRNLIGEGVPHS